MKIKCVITDDEPIARKGLRGYIEKTDFLTLTGECENALQLNELLKKEQPELLFMDIEMPYINGIDFLSGIHNPPKVIITSAYEQYALKGYELNVTDYLLKPIPFDRFLKAVNRVHELLQKEQESTPEPYLFVKTDKLLKKVTIQDILFIQIIVVNGDKRVQVPVLRTYNPFAVQKGELVHILPLVLHLQKGEDMGVVIGEGRVCTQGVSCQFSFYIGIFYTYPCFYLPGFSERCIQRYISGVDILIVAGIFTKRYRPQMAERIHKILSKTAFPALILLATIFFIQHHATITGQFGKLGLCISILILLAMGGGVVLSKSMRLNRKEQRTLIIEIGMQNAAQAIAVASSPFVFNNDIIAIPAIIYALMMNVILLVYVGIVKRR